VKIKSTFTPEEFMSMCLKWNINWIGQCALQSFTLWKNIQIFQLSLEQHCAHNSEIEGRGRIFAVPYKPIDDLILNTIHPMITKNMLSFDLIVGIDHEQGSMW